MQLKVHGSVRCHSGDKFRYNGMDVLNLGPRKFRGSDSLCFSIKHFSLHRKDADCREFGLVNSTIQIIWKNKTKIISAFEQSGSRIK